MKKVKTIGYSDKNKVKILDDCDEYILIKFKRNGDEIESCYGEVYLQGDESLGLYYHAEALDLLWKRIRGELEYLNLQREGKSCQEFLDDLLEKFKILMKTYIEELDKLKSNYSKLTESIAVH